MQKLVRIFSILALTTSLYAECRVDYAVMYLLANNERHMKRDIGFPYLISFNNDKDKEKAKKILNLNWLDNRTVDCINLDNCKKNLRSINELNIKNLDLGAFQINQRYFDYENLDDYFILKKSYNKACSIIYTHYQETKKWNWGTIARYHSKTKDYNRNYATQLKKRYISLLKLKEGA